MAYIVRGLYKGCIHSIYRLYIQFGYVVNTDRIENLCVEKGGFLWIIKKGFPELNDIHTNDILFTLYSHSYTRMKLVIQRVLRASVTVDDEMIGEIGKGLLIYVGIHDEDGDEEVKWMARKITTLRIFSDEEGKMNQSVMDVNGAVCLVSQFTLYGDATKGTRPSFVHAGRPEHAEPLYEKLVREVLKRGVSVETGSFGAMMDVSSVNDGPVTILLERGT